MREASSHRRRCIPIDRSVVAFHDAGRNRARAAALAEIDGAAQKPAMLRASFGYNQTHAELSET